MQITVEKIEGWAPKADAVKNARDLVRKGKFFDLEIDSGKTLIWGKCSGSGKNPYACSVDFIEENNPVFRCNCPSRQFPCKHGLGLLFAYEQGLAFAITAIPEDILSKREKIEKRQEKKAQEKEDLKESLKERAAKPRNANPAIALKRYNVQLEGVEMARKILKSIVQSGISAIDRKEITRLQAQVKELGNYYIGGIQVAFNDFLIELQAVTGEAYSNVIDSINYIAALLRKATEYLNHKKENIDERPEINSAIEEQIGTVWKLTDLIQLGLYEENAELLQLAFNSYDNQARKEWVDEGYWINLKTGKIYKTKNYRPYRAAKYIKEENSVAEVYVLKDLYVYPGDINPRVRWEADAVTERPASEADIEKVQTFAADNYAEMMKLLKNSIKNPLNDKNPLALIKINKAWLNGESIVLEDSAGIVLTLADDKDRQTSVIPFLKNILPQDPLNMSMLVMIDNNIQSGLLNGLPMALITSNKIVKLLF